MGTEKCPFCGQEIDAEAARCFFCGAKLDEESVEKRLEQLHAQEGRRFARRAGKPIILEAVVVLTLLYIVLFHGEPVGDRSPAIVHSSEGTTVRLNAKVVLAGARFTVSNNDSFDWENVKLEITPSAFGEPFGLNVPRISAGKTHSAEAAEFRRKDGSRFDPASMKPQQFWIRCDTPGSEKGSYMAGWK